MSSLSPVSKCKYLFGVEAEKIYTNIRDRRSVTQKRQLVDEYLELMMRISVYFLSKKDAFFLIDPMAFNNQCHLYALRAAQIKKTYHTKSDEEKFARTDENRFLHLSFFLSYALIGNTNLFVEAAQCALKEMGEKKMKKSFAAFIRDEGKYRETALASALLYETIIHESYLQALSVPEIFLINYPFSRGLTLEEGKGNEKILQGELSYCVNTLVQNDVEIGVLACNTLHLYMERLPKSAIPFLSLLCAFAPFVVSLR